MADPAFWVIGLGPVTDPADRSVIRTIQFGPAGGGGFQLQVRGSHETAQSWANLLNLAFARSPTLVRAVTGRLGGMQVQLVTPTGFGAAGKWVALNHGPRQAAVAGPGLEGYVYLDTKLFLQLASGRPGEAGQMQAAALAHELLHAAYGGARVARGELS